MSIGSYLKGTEGDLVTKRAAWRGTKTRLIVWAKQYSAAHVVGERESDMQKRILADAARDEKFPATVVRKVGKLMRRVDQASDEKRAALQVDLQDAMRDYAVSLGLGKAFS